MAKSNRTAHVYLPPTYSACFGDYFIAGISYVEDTYHINRPNSDWTIIEYVLQGTGTLLAPDGKEYILSKGDTYYLPRGSWHRYYTNYSEEQWGKIFINFSGDLFSHLLRDFGIDEQYVYPGLDILDELNHIYELVKHGGEQIEAECSALIFRIIYKMYAAAHRHDEELSDAARLKNYIDQNYTKHLEAADLAAMLYKSESQINRIFRQAYQITPHQYLINKKMEAARILLTTTRLSIKAISAKLSFADEFYFSNVFKRHTGKSPREYRQESIL